MPRTTAVARVVCLGLWLALCLGASTAHANPAPLPATASSTQEPAVPASGDAACAGPATDPIIPGPPVTLDECYVHQITVGGDTKSVTVWYTKQQVWYPITVDGRQERLEHWIDSDAQAQQVAAWVEEAWLRYYNDSGGHHLYVTGCDDNLNVRLHDTLGAFGLNDYHYSEFQPGWCWTVVDARRVRAGGGTSSSIDAQWLVYHAAQEALQASYDGGCGMNVYRPSYADFIEGFADLGADSVNAAMDALGFVNPGYTNIYSVYANGRYNRFVKYFIEQLGSLATPAEPWHHIDAMYDYYARCDAEDSLYVFENLVPALSGGQLSMEELFLNFFAANWAKHWADPATQPELVYYDDDTGAYMPPPVNDVDFRDGRVSNGAGTPNDWAGYYYEFTPPVTGCPFIEMEVDGDPGAKLGINFMAAKTTTPARVLRSGHIGEDHVRTFAGAGAHDRLAAAVNAFQNIYHYDLYATCVTPAVEIVEPRQANPVFVGAPEAPVGFLARWRVVNQRPGSDGDGVRGLEEADFVFDVEGVRPTVVPGSFQVVGDEYWAVLIPPVRSPENVFADLTIGLADVYDYLDTEAQSATRVARRVYTGFNAETCTYQAFQTEVDASATQLRLMVVGKQPDSADGYQRSVQVMSPAHQGWIEISPALTSPAPPAEWAIRNSPYDDVLIVSNPGEGLWQFRTCYTHAGSSTADVLMTVSLQSTFHLQGFLRGLTANQGQAGDVVGVAGMLMSQAGPMIPTTMAAVIEGPSGATNLPLYDDGAHGDGGAGDGIFAAPFGATVYGGGYSVRIVSRFEDPNRPGVNLMREWNGGFWLQGPRPELIDDPFDADDDGMSDAWETRHGLDPQTDDTHGDLDHDGLTNFEELRYGTSPANPDTDHGGESDNSEVDNDRDPLVAQDDQVAAVVPWYVHPLNAAIQVG